MSKLPPLLLRPKNKMAELVSVAVLMMCRVQQQLFPTAGAPQLRATYLTHNLTSTKKNESATNPMNNAVT